MYNIGKMKDRIDLLQEVNEGPVINLGGEAGYETIKSDLPAQKIKLMDKESIALKATENITRVNFIIRTRNLTTDLFIRCEEELYNILGYETLKDNERFTLIACQLVR